MASSKPSKSNPKIQPKSSASTTTAAAQKKTTHSLGAPSQHNQSSRKGKRAWRKNVDIQDVEEALEGMRGEERVVGTTLQKLSDTDLFQIDVQGDAQVRKSLPRFSSSLLTSTKILSQRSAVPAVFSRTTSRSASSAAKRKLKLTHEEKDRLLRIAKRPRKGPFNSVIDPTQPGEGSASAEITEAVKASGSYDPWAPSTKDEDGDERMGMDMVKQKQIKPPPAPPLKAVMASLPAVTLPHQGASYNPPVGSHQELLHLAHSAAEKQLKEIEKGADIKSKMENAGVIGGGGLEAHPASVEETGVPPGMVVYTIADEEVEEDEEGENDIPVKKMPERKTKAQRNKAARLLAEKRAQSRLIGQKHLNASVPSYKRLRLTQARAALQRAQQLAAKRGSEIERLKQHGLAGKKLGKHRVPEERLDVQLGEDLSESFRALKPEGNLFRDRFMSLQKRGAIEPRVPVLPKKRRLKTVEYEKHAWKRFE